MNDECEVITLSVEVQENGIIRNAAGCIIGRLVDSISFEQLRDVYGSSTLRPPPK